jgi:hypothetical protein
MERLRHATSILCKCSRILDWNAVEGNQQVEQLGGPVASGRDRLLFKNKFRGSYLQDLELFIFCQKIIWILSRDPAPLHKVNESVFHLSMIWKG